METSTRTRTRAKTAALLGLPALSLTMLGGYALTGVTPDANNDQIDSQSEVQAERMLNQKGIKITGDTGPGAGLSMVDVGAISAKAAPKAVPDSEAKKSSSASADDTAAKESASPNRRTSATAQKSRPRVPPLDNPNLRGDIKEADGDEGSGGGDDGGNTDDRKDCAVPKGSSATKVLVVDGTGGANADVRGCEKTKDGYKVEFSSAGHVGYNGIAAAGAKKEGDGKTPSGVYDLNEGFGVNSKPSEFSGDYTKVTSDYVWVDGNATKAGGYNTMQRKSQGYAGESLYQTPAYDYSQVINYNADRTPGKGSGIFLHVNTGSGKTAGCVSVTKSQLKKIFAWEDADSQIAITQ